MQDSMHHGFTITGIALVGRTPFFSGENSTTKKYVQIKPQSLNAHFFGGRGEMGPFSSFLFFLILILESLIDNVKQKY